MDKGWHTYWISKGDSGDPKFEWELLRVSMEDRSGQVGQNSFPAFNDLWLDDQVILPFILRSKIIPKQFEIGLKANWLVY